MLFLFYNFIMINEMIYDFDRMLECLMPRAPWQSVLTAEMWTSQTRNGESLLNLTRIFTKSHEITNF